MNWTVTPAWWRLLHGLYCKTTKQFSSFCSLCTRLNSTTAGDWLMTDTAAVAMTTSVDLELFLGPRRQDISTAVPMTVVYALIFVTGLIGNVATCVVIARNHYMHTTTNYCLFNLAISDLLMLLLGLPQETYTIWSAYPWIFGETFCVVRYWFIIFMLTVYTGDLFACRLAPMFFRCSKNHSVFFSNSRNSLSELQRRFNVSFNSFKR